MIVNEIVPKIQFVFLFHVDRFLGLNIARHSLDISLALHLAYDC